MKNLLQDSILLFTLIFYLLSFAESSATIRYVSKTGQSIPPYTSWLTAADSIQKCINISLFNDTIYVANGVYEEQVVMISGLALVGEGMDSCIVDARPLNVLYAVIVSESCLIKGFKIIASDTENMRCVNLSANNSLVTQNHITTASQGIYSSSSNSIIYKNIFDNIRTRGMSIYNSNCIIRKNFLSMMIGTLPDGIFILASSSNFRPIIDSNYIETRYNGIDKNVGSRATIRNNVIKLAGSMGSEGIFMHSYVSDSAWVYNNLIYTESSAAYAIENIGIPYLHVNNNYLTGNFLQYALYLFPNNVAKNNVITKSTRGVGKYGTPNPIFQYNNVWKNDINYSGFTPDTTNLSVDPMVMNDDPNQGDLDFHLQMYSPLINAGDPNILDKDATRSDIGLYGGPYGESYLYIDLPPRSPVNLTANVDSLIKLNWNKNTEADFSYYNVYRDTTFSLHCRFNKAYCFNF
jgi:hypothetical protein